MGTRRLWAPFVCEGTSKTGPVAGTIGVGFDWVLLPVVVPLLNRMMAML